MEDYFYFHQLCENFIGKCVTGKCIYPDNLFDVNFSIKKDPKKWTIFWQKKHLFDRFSTMKSLPFRNWTFWKKTQGEKTQNSRKKLNNSSKKLKVSANFCRVVVQNHVFCYWNLTRVHENSIENSKFMLF